MGQKWKILIAVKSAFGSALYSYLIYSMIKNETAIYLFFAYFMLFCLAFTSVYGIMFKHNIQYSKYMLGIGMSSIIAISYFVLIIYQVEFNYINPIIIFSISFICCFIFIYLAARHNNYPPV